MMNPSRWSGRIFKVFNTKEKREHFSCKQSVRWDERQKQKVEQAERARRNVQDADDENDH